MRCYTLVNVFPCVQGESTAGAGAMVSTVVEDAFYVCTLAGRRAFATGNADAAVSAASGSGVCKFRSVSSVELSLCCVAFMLVFAFFSHDRRVL